MEDLTSKQNEERRQLTDEIETRRAARERRDAAFSSGIIIDDNTIDELKLYAETFKEAFNNQQTAESDLHGAQARELTARTRIGNQINDTIATKLDYEGLENISHYAKLAGNIAVREASRDALKLWLGDFNNDDRLSDLRDAEQILFQWLSEPQIKSVDTNTYKYSLLALIIISAIATIITAIHVNPIWYLLLLPIGIIAILGWPKQITESEQHQVIEARYSKLGLQMPRDWTAEEVQSLLADLRSKLAKAKFFEEKFVFWNSRKAESEKLDRDKQTLEAKRNEIQDLYGSSIITADIENGLIYPFCDSLVSWRKFATELLTAQQKVDDCRQYTKDAHNRLNEEIFSFW